MQQNLASQLSGRRRALWLALLVIASVAFTLGFACAMPFAALGAAAALTLGRRDALLLTGAAWLANQLVGFAILAYPWDASTLVWGVTLGGVALLTTLGAQWLVRVLYGYRASAVALAAFAGAFAVYEGALFVVSATLLGGTEVFAPDIMARIFAINAAAFIGFFVLHGIGTALGLAAKPALPIRAVARPA
jgi:hypothetical protein